MSKYKVYIKDVVRKAAAQPSTRKGGGSYATRPMLHVFALLLVATAFSTIG